MFVLDDGCAKIAVEVDGCAKIAVEVAASWTQNRGEILAFVRINRLLGWGES